MYKGIGQPIDMHRLYVYLEAALGAVESREVIGRATSHIWDTECFFH